MIQYSNINDAWGNKDLLKKNSINNLNNKSIESNLEVLPPKIVPNIVPNVVPNDIKPKLPNTDVAKIPVKFPQYQPPVIVPNTEVKEHFFQTHTSSKSCSFAEHLKTCEECRNSLYEYLGNESTTSTIDLFGLKITVSKDILKIIFIILIICIFIILLSMVNVSLKEETNMKYFMMPSQMPYFRPYQ
jgi:hypothetical protein